LILVIINNLDVESIHHPSGQSPLGGSDKNGVLSDNSGNLQRAWSVHRFPNGPDQKNAGSPCQVLLDARDVSPGAIPLGHGLSPQVIYWGWLHVHGLSPARGNPMLNQYWHHHLLRWLLLRQVKRYRHNVSSEH